MTAQTPSSAGDHGQRPRLVLDDPVALAWGACLIRTALERRRQRLAAEVAAWAAECAADGGERDDIAS